MSKGKRYTEEFKIEAVKQVTDRGYSVNEVAERLGITTKSLYNWRSQLSGKKSVHTSSDNSVRIAKLEAELKRVTEERDILKKADVDSSDHRNTLFNHV
ncbi:transposase [Agaribacter marinus]|uniref:Transposase n=1 Tax=Agaribacter marinus TaxID=1431249 RepID=A0AA37WKH2_9ALTE|nr:transposase [Agaribacter marinus]